LSDKIQAHNVSVVGLKGGVGASRYSAAFHKKRLPLLLCSKPERQAADACAVWQEKKLSV